MEQNIKEMERLLERRCEELKQKNSYDVFGVWEGCGSEVVKERYYALVKENHPDRYGGNVSSQVKILSQEIFLQIQKSFRQLLKVETTQRTPDPASERGAAIERLSKLASQHEASKPDAAPAPEPAQQVQAPSTYTQPAPEPGMSSANEVFEAVTVSTRDASTLKEESVPEEERRAKLARLARLARPRPQVTPAVAAAPSGLDEEERRAKLARLAAKRPAPPAAMRQTGREQVNSEPAAPVTSARQAATMSHTALLPDQPQTPKDFFNLGFSELRTNNRPAYALPHLKHAYEAEPENGLFATFYGYALFLMEPDQKREAEAILRKAIESKHRQAAPDAHLFMGYILKTYDSESKQVQAHREFQRALSLNPSSHEAQREVRLYERRKKEQQPKPQDDVGAFLGKLFKK